MHETLSKSLWLLLALVACSSSAESDQGDASPTSNAGSTASAGNGGQSSSNAGTTNPAGSTNSAGSNTAGVGGENPNLGGSAGMGGAEAGGAGMANAGAAGTAGDAGAGGTAGAANGGAAGATEDPTSPGGSSEEPPLTWQEHWFEHNQNVARADYNEWVVLYFDADVDQDQSVWLMSFLTDVWKYTVKHYGEFTDGARDGRLYAIFHQGRYSGGHPSTYFDESHDYRNVSDAGPGPWPEGSYDLASHEVSHIVEGASRGVHGSPAFGLWGDSKWAEFYQYDLYLGLGMTEEAERVFEMFTNGSDSFPQADTHWFRDWFYPLWLDHGGVAVMVNYFQLLAEHFPKNGSDYAGGLNFGEYVHFMSGAAGTDLKDLATTAFGWPAERELEFQDAQAEFAGIQY